MTAHVTRQQRRQMQRLADEADLAVEGDRKFFARHTERTYRVRLISAAERRQVEIAQRRPIHAGPDQSVFVAIKQLADGVRLRATILGPTDSIGEELTDAEAGAVFEGYADLHPWVRDREVAMRAAFKRHRDAARGRGPDAA